MPRYVAAPLPDGCPWSGWAPPNVDWCEEQLCALVVNPADAWSNLAYIAVGLWMWRAARAERSAALSIFGPAALFVGLASGVYHASYTAFFQFFDFVSMFVFTTAIITFDAVRLGWVAERHALRFGLAGVAISSALVPVVNETEVPIQAMVGVHIAVILLQEGLAARRRVDGPGPVNRSGLWLGLVLLAAAAICSASDLTRTVCDPDNHWISGHALWHVLSAAALVAIFVYFRGLPGRAGASTERG